MEITIEKYQNIIDMLRSPDEENKVVALTIIDQIDFKSNITKILLLKKHSESNKSQWEEHAPKIYKELETLAADKIIDLNKHLTYKQVLSAITRLQVDQEEFQFYMNDFTQYLLRQIQSMGYDYIEDIDITLKYKEHEQSRELSESK
jgi:hypothetical protein